MKNQREHSLSDPDFVARKKKGDHSSNLRSSNLRSRKNSFPEGWEIGNAELAVASLVGWDLPKAEEQFDRFRNWCLDKGRTSANWPAAWQTWCQRGLEYEEKQDTSSKPKTGFASAVVGIEEWLREKKRSPGHGGD